jgi:hypothetical protein|eukprot:scaffold2045_cov203-Alexandrium_tamarense.AAC.26
MVARVEPLEVGRRGSQQDGRRRSGGVVWVKSGESEKHIKARLGLCSPIRRLPYTQQCPKMEASSEGTIDPNVLVLHRHVLKNGFVALLCGKRLSGPELCTLDME